MNTKFTFLMLTALIIAVASNAQINKGNTALGGNLSFSTITEKMPGDKYTNTSVTVAPTFMLVYNNNRAIGFVLRYAHAETSFFQLKTNSYGGGVFIRQYKPLGKGFYVFAQETLNFDDNESKSILSSDSALVYSDDKDYTTSITANPGLAFDLSKKFQLELLFFNNLLSAGYSYTTSKPNFVYNVVDKSNSFYINTNLDFSQLTSLNIGAKIFFGR